MKTIYNASRVTDYSGEPPILTYSNTVTTVIREPAPTPVITRFFYRICCNCNCGCGCFNGCRRCGWFDNCNRCPFNCPCGWVNRQNNCGCRCGCRN